MFPSTLNRNLHKPTSGSKLRKSVTWENLPPAITTPTTPAPTRAHTSASAAFTSPTPLQRQYHPTQPSKPAPPQETEAEDDTDDTPTITSAGSRNYINPGWSLLRAEQIRKHILALEGQHGNGRSAEIRRDSGFVDISQEGVESEEMQVEYPELPDGNEEAGEMGANSGCIGKGKGKGKERATGEGESSRMQGMRVEYPSLPSMED